MALIDDFKARFPTFNTTTVDSIFPLLEPEYPCYFDRTYGDNDCDDAAILMLLAHLFVVETSATYTGTGGNAAAIRSEQSKSVGSVSVSYDAITQSGGGLYDFFRTTSYGQRFLRMIAKYRGGAVFV